MQSLQAYLSHWLQKATAKDSEFVQISQQILLLRAFLCLAYIDFKRLIMKADLSSSSSPSGRTVSLRHSGQGKGLPLATLKANLWMHCLQ